MSVHRDDIITRIEQWLQPGLFSDYCPNGLQVEGRESVERIVTGVTASQRFLDLALEADADMVLVHHGYFWKGEDLRIRGMRKRRIQTLLSRDLSLAAYHLPLDAHPELGNNACLGQALDISQARPVTDAPTELLWEGVFREGLPADSFAERLAYRLGQSPLHVGDGPSSIRRLAWCSGGAQGFIERAVALGVDAYVSGEISEQTVHIARENGIHYFAAGHHATERLGVQALGERLQRELEVEHLFIDDPSPA